jgi:hypothetical protein
VTFDNELVKLPLNDFDFERLEFRALSQKRNMKWNENFWGNRSTEKNATLPVLSSLLIREFQVLSTRI